MIYHIYLSHHSSNHILLPHVAYHHHTISPMLHTLQEKSLHLTDIPKSILHQHNGTFVLITSHTNYRCLAKSPHPHSRHSEFRYVFIADKHQVLVLLSYNRMYRYQNQLVHHHTLLHDLLAAYHLNNR